MIAGRFITAIMACDENGAVGKDNKLPWDCPEDLAHFRETTSGHYMVMGSLTYLSMPERAFEKRHGIVLSTTMAEHKNNITFLPNISLLYSEIKEVPLDKNIFVVGGVNLVEQLFKLNAIDKFTLSQIQGRYESDCTFSHDLLNKLKNWNSSKPEKKTGFEIYNYINPSACNLG